MKRGWPNITKRTLLVAKRAGIDPNDRQAVREFKIEMLNHIKSVASDFRRKKKSVDMPAGQA